MAFTQSLNERYFDKKTLLCVGLDGDYAALQKVGFRGTLFDYNKIIIDATCDYALAFKPQIAYYSAYGLEQDLIDTIAYIKTASPKIPVILDAKRGDIGSTMAKYGQEVYDRMGADAVTVSPYMGADSVMPLAQYGDKGIVLLANTSNPSAILQTKIINDKPLYVHFLDSIMINMDDTSQLAFVVGAGCANALTYLSKNYSENWILCPGVGAQGGTVQQVLSNIIYTDIPRVLINVSRSIALYSHSPTAISKHAETQALELLQQMHDHI